MSKQEIDIKLLPCPFCGGKPSLLDNLIPDSEIPAGREQLAIVTCLDCGSLAKPGEGIARAKTAIWLWNKRYKGVKDD